ncbi:hypothetical protein F5B22DRAFT_644942 [Xylaria bambusicola]|uniref:uncharacterized protein n=1 Tax=Xylaria bambusicola TaxID=326684 RepID=UPI002007D31B|nr:uncharacterized protein F5B22DRAFT_644942 [Xylaria bambusicola]KAI0518179.1 hypothetical protein F5B22DRAFT_644942 [Xylaria bambusicola]
MSENCITDNFATNWLPHFSPEGNILPDVSFKVDCQICSKSLAISDPADGENFETFTVLPCGHAFGLEDVQTWVIASDSATCPSCREPLWHRDCEHYISLRPLEAGMNNMRKAISKCIRQIPPKCRHCRHGNADDSPSDDHGDDAPGPLFDEAELARLFIGDNATAHDEAEPEILFIDNNGAAHRVELRSSRNVHGPRQRVQLASGVQVTYDPRAASPPQRLPRRSARHYAETGQQPPNLQRRNAIVGGMATAPDFGSRRSERGRSRQHGPPIQGQWDDVDELMERMARRIGRDPLLCRYLVHLTIFVLMCLVSTVLLIYDGFRKMIERRDGE